MRYNEEDETLGRPPAMSTAPKRLMTPEEYLAYERSSEEKHEFYRGEIFAMSGVSYEHSQINANLMRELGNRLAGSTCQPHASDLRVCVHPSGLYTYPDVLVVCGRPRFLDKRFDTLLNPTMIVEILSESTQSYDRGAKFEQYQRIESLRTYVLVSQEAMRVEWFTRSEDGAWIYRAANGPDGVLDLPDTLAIPVAIPLSEIYERVEFEARVELE
jgi:Uma2 family endonuclease